MRELSNDLLVEAYLKAKELDLDKDFQHIIRKEMDRRRITIQQEQRGSENRNKYKRKTLNCVTGTYL
ncbi:sporulation histidine kinase inhibitor Sda [Lentibacillus sp. N15]|uniref:sporulation histidine kinase inhibitor Sda n=1 Tax=Lentibacillus songyuanensis TaxID=3136161 RepID=UPI0031BA3C3A